MVKQSQRPRMLGMAALACLVVGCTTVLIPPPSPKEPRNVYVVDDGYHAFLILPEPDGQFVKYTFGDWDFFALGKDDVWHGFLALCFPTQGALGRRRYSVDSPPSVVEGDRALKLSVAGSRVEALLDNLDARFHSSRDTPHYSPMYDLHFVKDGTSYICYRNCNTELVAWLEELGCEIRGPGFFADFEMH